MKMARGLLLTFVLIAGCAPLPGEWTRTEPPAADVDAALLFLDRLAAASADELDAMPASEPAPPDRPEQQLHRVLWLATPGHPGHDPDEAVAALQARLAAETTPPAVRALLHLQLRHLEARRKRARAVRQLRRENERLREQIRALTALERRMRDDVEGRPAGGPAETSQ